MKLTKVLFLCTGNSARSQMAEAILRQRAGDHFEVHSAGMEPKGIHPFTLRVMEELGYDLSKQRSKDVAEYLGKHHFGYLITVCAHAEAQCPRTFVGVSKRIHWPTEDPAAFHGSPEETLEKFRQVHDEISTYIESWLDELDLSRGDGTGIRSDWEH